MQCWLFVGTRKWLQRNATPSLKTGSTGGLGQWWEGVFSFCAFESWDYIWIYYLCRKSKQISKEVAEEKPNTDRPGGTPGLPFGFGPAWLRCSTSRVIFWFSHPQGNPANRHQVLCWVSAKPGCGYDEAPGMAWSTYLQDDAASTRGMETCQFLLASDLLLWLCAYKPSPQLSWWQRLGSSLPPSPASLLSSFPSFFLYSVSIHCASNPLLGLEGIFRVLYKCVPPDFLSTKPQFP